jgi:hypothetical protein
MLQTQVNQKARMELAERAVATKLSKNLSFEQIAEGTGLNVCEYLHGHFSEAIFDLRDSRDSTFSGLRAQTSD